MNCSYLQVKCETWNRDSFSLFDYDTKQKTTQELEIESSGIFIRKENTISFLPEDSCPEHHILIKVYENFNEFVLYPTKEQKIGIVVNKYKSKSNRGYLLSEGDLIKLGKAKLKVIKINSVDERDENNKDESCNEFEGSNAGDITCRICFRTHTNYIDPLISVCNCAGSMKLVHILCLQK